MSHLLICAFISICAIRAGALDLAGDARAWTQEIVQQCQKNSPASDTEKLACTWPDVYAEFENSKKDLSVDSSLLLSLASGVFEFDQFANANPIDARVARWLFAIRFVRQTWPFAQQKMSQKNFAEQALLTSALTSTDGWSTVWSAYANLDCTQNSSRNCLRAKAVFLVSLSEAVSKIENDVALELMINAATNSTAADVVLGGDIKKTRESLEHIVGSFTGENPSFYFSGSGDTSLILAKSKLEEWLGYRKTRAFEGEVAPLALEPNACANLQSGAKFFHQYTFICDSRDDGGIEVSIPSVLQWPRPIFDPPLDFSVRHARANLASVLVPSKFEVSRLTLIKLLHEVSSFSATSMKLKSLSASGDLRKIGSLISSNPVLVNSLVSELTDSYNAARRAGLQ